MSSYCPVCGLDEELNFDPPDPYYEAIKLNRIRKQKLRKKFSKIDK